MSFPGAYCLVSNGPSPIVCIIEIQGLFQATFRLVLALLKGLKILNTGSPTVFLFHRRRRVF